MELYYKMGSTQTPFASHPCNGDGAVESFTNLPTTDGTQESLISRTGRAEIL